MQQRYIPKRLFNYLFYLICMSDSCQHLNGRFYIWFWNSSTSSCLCHLTLLVCVTSLFLSVSPHSSCLCHLTLLVCVTSLFLSVSPHSSCLCHLTLLVSHLSSRDKWNLICDVEVCAWLFEVLFHTHPLPRYIHSLFTFLMKDRLTNKSLHKIIFILFLLSRVLNLLTEKWK